MIDEFNGREYTNDTAAETARYGERESYGDNPTAEEFPNYDETPKNAPKPRKSGVGKLFSALTAAVAAVVMAVVLAPAVFDTGQTEVEFAELWSTDTAIGYTVFLNGGESDGLRLVVYNDFTERSQEFDGNAVSGEASGLKPNVTYAVAVKSGDKTIAEKRLCTKKTEEMPVTELRSVTHECTCDVDGMFHFRMDFADENGYWYDLRATLTDEFGTVSLCAFTDDPHQDQEISVSDAGLLGSRAVFRIVCSSRETGETEMILYETTVQI